MHITILTYGSRGDVQPYIALGVGLRRAGHTVRVAAPEAFEAFVTAHGLEFAPLAGDPAQLSRDLVDRAGGKTLRMMQVMAEYVVPLALQVQAQVKEACEGTEAIIHSFLLAVSGHLIARERGIPDFFAQMYPIFTSTRAFPHMLFPALPLGGTYNRLTHDLYNGLFWQISRGMYGWLRRSHPELPSHIVWPFAPAYPHQPPILYGFSPQVIPPSPDWGAHVHVTGYWFLDHDPAWQPPADLIAFLEAGPPPVCIGFGSMVSQEMQIITQLALESLKKSGQRGVLLAGWSGLGRAGGTPTSYGDDVFVADAVPHDWLFPRMAAVVHHGGAGTTAAGLRAGAPSILVPFTADQPFWGRWVSDLGVGPEPIPRRRLTADRLAYAIRVAVAHGPIRQRAAALGERIRAEDGVARAVEIVELRLAGGD